MTGTSQEQSFGGTAVILFLSFAPIEHMREPDAALASIGTELAELIPLLADRLGDLLDLSAGALASLIRARQLEYEDRPGPLPPEYYTVLSQRVARMVAGTLPPRGRWMSGYYFNSAILRIGPAREKLRRLLEQIDKAKKGGGTARRSLPKGEFDAVHSEYRVLKHDLKGLQDARLVTYEQAVDALREFVSVLKDRKGELCNAAIKLPRMQAKPRVKRSQTTRAS